jgi:hypothetical protein
MNVRPHPRDQQVSHFWSHARPTRSKRAYMAGKKQAYMGQRTGNLMEEEPGVQELKWRKNQVPYLPINNDSGEQCRGPSPARPRHFQLCPIRRVFCRRRLRRWTLWHCRRLVSANEEVKTRLFLFWTWWCFVPKSSNIPKYLDHFPNRVFSCIDTGRGAAALGKTSSQPPVPLEPKSWILFSSVNGAAWLGFQCFFQMQGRHTW